MIVAMPYLSRINTLLLRVLGKVLPGVGLNLLRASRAHEHSNGGPVAVTVHLQPAQEVLVLLVRPRPRVELTGPGATEFGEHCKGVGERCMSFGEVRLTAMNHDGRWIQQRRPVFLILVMHHAQLQTSAMSRKAVGDDKCRCRSYGKQSCRQRATLACISTAVPW